MSDSRAGSSFSIPWPLLVTLLGALGGAYFLIPPLISSRPSQDSGTGATAAGESQDVAARLWEDPFRPAEAHLAGERGGGGGARKGKLVIPATSSGASASIAAELEEDKADPHDAVHTLDHLRSALRREAGPAAGRNPKVLVLPVMVEGGPFPERIEQRLRTRHAILSGLANSGFVPDDPEHIGYVQAVWPRERGDDGVARRTLKAMRGAKSDHEPKLLIPYEWCRRSLVAPPIPAAHGAKTGPAAWQAVLVLWLREEEFADAVLPRLAHLLDGLVGENAEANKWCDVRVIGPRTSPVLANLQAGVEMDDCEVMKPLEGVIAYSPTATASADVITARAAELRQALGFMSTGFEICRITPTDADLAKTLVEELGRRGIDLTDGGSGGAHPHVALIAEWDSFYGRALPYTFAHATRSVPPPPTQPVDLMKQPDRVPAFIHQFTYLRGIDGRSVGGDGGGKSGGGGGGGANSGRAGGSSGGASALFMPRNSYAENPEGTNQSDYIRRLAFDLREIDRRLFREKGEGLRAVGVLGSDLYDTLLILRALRPVLPHAVFFTTNLDARMGFPAEWAAAHNLVIVSGFGLSLNPYYQRAIPPFRDSNQTATFAATLCATGVMPTDTLGALLGNPRIFEVGRRGPRDMSVDSLSDQRGDHVPLNQVLSAAYPGGPKTLHPSRRELAGWWTGHRLGWLFVLLLAGVGAWIVFRHARDKPDLHTQPTPTPTATPTPTPVLTPIATPPAAARAFLWLGHRKVFYIGATLLVALLVGVLGRAQAIEGEPLALFDGLSAWPTIAIRLFAALLCVHLIARHVAQAHTNDLELVNLFFKGEQNVKLPVDRPDSPGQYGGWCMQSSLSCLWRGEWDKAIDEQTGKVSAVELWRTYARHSHWRYRVIRTSLLALAFLVVVMCLLGMFGAPRQPIRGWSAVAAYKVVAGAAVIAGALLTFLAIDATLVNVRFIQTLTKAETDWPPHAYQQCSARQMLAPDLADFLDIMLIAKRTDVVGRLVYFPLLILLLLIVSHLSVFDNWSWPPGAVACYALSAGLSVIGAVALRRAAEGARRNALARMQERWVRYVGKGDKMAGAMEQLMKEVRAEHRGAFSFLAQYPVLAGILLPSGGLGVYVLLDYLLKGP